MKRHEFLNWLIDHHWGGNREVRYLEIGVRTGYTFLNVRSDYRYSVDPNFPATFKMTSNEFFQLNKARRLRFDLVFVDGLHQREQVVRDVLNSTAILNRGGIVIIDDCRPLEEYQQVSADAPPDGRPWCGDVWKGVVDLRHDRTLDICVIDKGWGFGIVLVRPNSNPITAPKNLDWKLYERARNLLLRLIPFSKLPDFLEGYDVPPTQLDG